MPRIVDDLKEIIAQWRGELGQLPRNGRTGVLLSFFLLFVVGTLATVGFVNHKVSTSLDGAHGQVQVDQAELKEAAQARSKQFVQTFITDDAALQDSLSELPVDLLVAYKLTLYFLPFFIALMGFDQVAGDVGTKSMRYLVVRARRGSILLGKLLAQATLLAALLVASVVAMVVVAKLLNADFGVLAALGWGLKLIASALVMASAYLALTALCSAVARQGAVALVMNLIGLVVLWFTAWVGEEAFLFPGEKAAGLMDMLRTESMGAYVRYASVWHFRQDLLHPEAGRLLAAVAVHVGFAMACIGLARHTLAGRDL